VFFMTAAKLAPEDLDGEYDVYDAHECTLGSPCLAGPGGSLPECTTAEACRAAPSPQPSIFGAPSSATFSGAGNVPPVTPAKPVVLTRAQLLAKALKVCHADKRKTKRVACERAARKKYGPKPKAKSKGKKSSRGRSGSVR
jgi:hypothetical protein